jgi:uncharacterized protein (DUF433 family)
MVTEERIAPWMATQLERMATMRPQRMAQLLASLYAAHPELEIELAAMAVDDELITADEAAKSLNISQQVVDEAVEAFRSNLAVEASEAVLVKDVNGVARLAKHHIAVWEVVRAYREHSSVSAVVAAFPGLSQWDVRAALGYAGNNPNEIGELVEQYEQYLERTRAAYPFAQVDRSSSS